MGIKLFDAKTKQTIWHGTAGDALCDNADDNAQATEQAIAKLFNNFPPAGPAL